MCVWICRSCNDGVLDELVAPAGPIIESNVMAGVGGEGVRPAGREKLVDVFAASGVGALVDGACFEASSRTIDGTGGTSGIGGDPVAAAKPPLPNLFEYGNRSLLAFVLPGLRYVVLVERFKLDPGTDGSMISPFVPSPCSP